MPNLHLPFLIKGDYKPKTPLVKLMLLLQYQKIVTVSVDGSIIVWQIKDSLEMLEPKIILLPGFNEFNLTSMTLYYKPVQYYTVFIF